MIYSESVIELLERLCELKGFQVHEMDMTVLTNESTV